MRVPQILLQIIMLIIRHVQFSLILIGKELLLVTMLLRVTVSEIVLLSTCL